jgi:aryl-alcohol dehydrogenase-like predicted oxidoreductase
LPAGIACVQIFYNLLDRSDEPLLDECREHDLAWIPFFPLGSAFLARPKVTGHPAVVAAAAALDVTPAQIGLAWLLAHDPHILLIPGTASAVHLAQNVAAASLILPLRNDVHPRRSGQTRRLTPEPLGSLAWQPSGVESTPAAGFT